jgi:hypothetical protein
MAGFLLMDVDWQATGSRSELWDRRQVCRKNRMGAQASSRAREELRPCGHLCLYRSGLGVFGEIQVAFADNKAGGTPAGLLPIVRSPDNSQACDALEAFGDRLLTFGAGFEGVGFEGTLDCFIAQSAEEQQRL